MSKGDGRERYSLRSVGFMVILTCFLALLSYYLPDYFGDLKLLFYLGFAICGLRAMHMGAHVN